MARGRRTHNNLRTLAVLAVIAVFAVEAAVRIADSNSPVMSIDGQSCQCVIFYSCEVTDTVSIPSGSSSGCEDSYVCCRVQTESPVSNSPGETSSEVSSVDYPTTQKQDIDQQQCTCVSKNQCSDSNSNEYSNSGDCSHNQVCCNRKHIISENTGIDDTHQYNTQCGIGMSSSKTKYNRKVNDETYFGQFPWMVIISKTNSDQTTDSKTGDMAFCGGSLIHPRVVLTAAHCVRNLNPNLIQVKVGVWDTTNRDNEEIIGVSEIVVHHNHNNGSMSDDVALLKLYSEYDKREHINTICIPDNKKEAKYDPDSCIVTGWGKINHGDKHGTNVLKKVELSIVPNDVCQQKLRKTRLGDYFRLHESFVCAGGEKGRDVCHGDGGGPLICAVKDDSYDGKKYIQVGIVSWGIGCGDEDVPGVYSSVQANSQWINKKLELLSQSNL